MKYQIIYADPPWDYKGQHQHTLVKESGGSDKHYPTLKLSQLKDLDVKSITDENALLFMWSSSPHLDQAIQLGSAWGFKYSTIAFVWYKQKTNPGFYTMSECEICLVFKKGRIPKPRGNRNIRQFISSLRQAHSQKPDEVRMRITKMFPTQNKIELFARSKSPGWDAIGDGVEPGVDITKSIKRKVKKRIRSTK